MKKTVTKAASKVNSLFRHNGIKKGKRKPPGQVPGTAIHTGIQKLDEVLITVYDFDDQHFESVPIQDIGEAEPYLKSKSKTWIQVRGLHDINKLKTVWDYFNLHPLVQEDIVNTSQRPKVEPYSDMVFVVLRMIALSTEKQEQLKLQTEQVSLILGKNYVLSFQESDEPIFDPVIKRLEMPATRLRTYRPDYLAYALIDTIVDHYFHALDLTSESIETIEEQIIINSSPNILQTIHALRRDLIYFRKSVWSLRDGINSLIRDDSPLIGTDIKVYLRDVYDHIVQIIDSIDNSRDMVYSLFDMYMSGLSSRMNEVMKVLTIIATIFIPLTFIAGIYGMNFNPEASPYNMPELNWYWGYPVSIAGMLVLVILMLFYFRKKEWI